MKNLKKALAVLLLGAMALSLAACGADDAEPTPDPHDGMIYVNTGAVKSGWTKPKACPSPS